MDNEPIPVEEPTVEVIDLTDSSEWFPLNKAYDDIMNILSQAPEELSRRLYLKLCAKYGISAWKDTK